MIPRLFVLLFLCLEIFMPCPCFAEDPYPREITICYGHWKPYEYMEGKKTKGVNVEVVEAAAKRLGVRIRWKAYPWSRCMQSARIGLVDGLMSLYRTAEREKVLYYPDENLNVDQSVFITYPGSGVTFDGSLTSLTGEEVMVARENSHGKAFDTAQNFTKISVPSHENVILMVSARRHQLGIGSRGFFEIFMRENHLSDRVVFIDPPYLIQTYFAFTRKKGPGYRRLADDMGKALKALKKTGAYETIQKKYGFSPG